jgi:two-component system alkaline phosphatase synthesis response regulator PhoP/two-component system response regulator ResD
MPEPAPLVLVTDDEPHIVEVVDLYLRKSGYRTVTAGTGQGCLDAVRLNQPDLVILDLMLPDADGVDVCREIRRRGETPVIMLTARDSDVDKITGLHVGADDYVVKPFNPVELVARVQAILRRVRPPEASPGEIRYADLIVDPATRTAAIGDAPLALRPKEFDLLHAFARLPGVALDRAQLLTLAWGADFFGDQRTVDVHVAWLRDKLKTSRLRIETVWGIGYRLVETAG